MTARLYTMPPSNFCEKARWALDLAQVAYVEEAHAPGLHLLAMKRLGVTTLPVLDLGDGSRLEDSTDILFHLAEAHPHLGLLPEDPALAAEVRALEDELDAEFIPVFRAWFCDWMSRDLASVRVCTHRRASPLQRLVAPLLAFKTQRVLGEKAALFEGSSDERYERLLAVWARYDERLRDRRYLVGDTFTLADLTLAAHAGPMLAPEGFGGGVVPVGQRAEPVRAQTLHLRATPAGQHVLRMYAEHRMPLVAAESAA